MQNDESGAPTHHPEDEEDGDVLSPVELRGKEFKRYARAAAAMSGLYDDAALARRLGRSRITVGQWWKGARPDPAALKRLEEVTGLSTDELAAWFYFDGPAPSWPVPADSAAREAIREGTRRDREPRPAGGPPAPAASPERPTRDTRAGRG